MAIQNVQFSLQEYLKFALRGTLQAIHQTRKTMFEHIPKHREESCKNTTRTGTLLTSFGVFLNVVNTVSSA